MAMANVNGVRLFYEVNGTGEVPLVLVHGSWDSLTLGDKSPATFAPVVAKLAKAIPRVEVVTVRGAGHVPHATHPEAYIQVITAFTRKHSVRSGRAVTLLTLRVVTIHGQVFWYRR